MPLPGDPAGRGRPQWPLAAAWTVSVASLLVIALLPRAVTHAFGAFLLVGSAGALIVVLVYARLLRRRMTPPPRTVLLVGGPWEGRMLLARTGPMPEEIQLAGPGAPPCSYRRRAGDRDRPRLRVLRYEPDDGSRPQWPVPGGRGTAVARGDQGSTQCLGKEAL